MNNQFYYTPRCKHYISHSIHPFHVNPTQSCILHGSLSIGLRRFHFIVSTKGCLGSDTRSIIYTNHLYIYIYIYTGTHFNSTLKRLSIPLYIYTSAHAPYAQVYRLGSYVVVPRVSVLVPRAAVDLLSARYTWLLRVRSLEEVGTLVPPAPRLAWNHNCSHCTLQASASERGRGWNHVSIVTRMRIGEF